MLNKLRSDKNLKYIDLHGLFSKEALEILDEQIQYLKQAIRSNRVDEYLNIKKKKGITYVIYEIITGRGSHSVDKKPILYFQIKEYLENELGIQTKGE